MANNIICNGTFQLQTQAGNVPLAISINVPGTGSNFVYTAQDITTSTWQALNTSSLSDLRYIAADNIGSGSIQIAKDSSGTNVIAILQTNDNCIIPMSASIASAPLFAKAFTSASTLIYMLAES